MIRKAAQTTRRSFTIKKSIRTMWIALAILGVPCFLATLAAGKGGSFGTVATVGVVMAVWSHRARVVRVFDRHLAIKMAPLARLSLVQFEDILRVHTVGRKLKVTYRDGERSRDVVIPLKMLADEDGEWLEDHLAQFGEAA